MRNLSILCKDFHFPTSMESISSVKNEVAFDDAMMQEVFEGAHSISTDSRKTIGLFA
jgi:hypothetical protein